VVVGLLLHLLKNLRPNALTLPAVKRELIVFTLRIVLEGHAKHHHFVISREYRLRQCGDYALAVRHEVFGVEERLKARPLLVSEVIPSCHASSL